MSLFSQALSHKATMLSIDVETQVDIDDIDAQTPVEEVHAELSDDLNQMEKHIDDLEASQQAEVTLESLSAVLKKSLRNGGMTQVELETFAICQSAIGQTLKVSVSAAPDLQSYGRLGAYEYTALSAEQTEQAKKGVVEKIKALLKKIVDFVVRIYHKVTFSTKRIQDKAKSCLIQLQGIPPHFAELPTITDPSIIKAISIPQFSVHELVNQFKAADELHRLVEEEIVKLLNDPGKSTDEMVMLFITKSQKIKLGDFPVFKETPDDRPISERLKFWKRGAPQKLPESLPVLDQSDLKILLNNIKEFQKPTLRVEQLQQKLNKVIELGLERQERMMGVIEAKEALAGENSLPIDTDAINRASVHFFTKHIMPPLLQYCATANLSRAKYAFHLLRYCEACINEYKKINTSFKA